MDALEFFKERRRICKLYSDSYNGCCECPLAESRCVISDTASDEDLKRIVTAVEQWSKEHPRKTRQSVFLEQYPCAQIDSQDVLYACPADVYGNNACPKNKEDAPIICYDCRREFWMQEVE